MAESKISARDIIVLLDIDDNGIFKSVACLTSNDLDTQRSPIDATSKCGDEMQPGDSIVQKVTGSGFAIDQTGTPSKESYSSLYTLLVNGTIVPAQFGRATNVSGDIYYEGDVTVSSLKITAADKDDVKFDVEFTVTTPPLTQSTY
jgi:hypothetical protein